MRLPAMLRAAALTLIGACTGEAGSSADFGGTAADDGTEATAGTDLGIPGTTTDDTADSGDSEGGESTGDEVDVPDFPWARGIRLPRITANQGVQVSLVEDGRAVAPEDYNTRIISGRRTLVRGFWSLHADFEPRELIGRLTIDYPDGSTLVQDYPVMVTGESGDGGASFQWLLQPDEVVPGMLFRARVLESDSNYADGDISEPPPIAPLSGRALVGIYDVPLQMRVILVPVQHEFEGCTQAPEPTADDVDVMRQQLEQNNPVQSAIVTLGEPMVYTDAIGTSGAGFSPVLSALALHQLEIGSADNEYLYGIVDPCDGFPPGLLGQAIGIPGEPLPELAGARISMGRWLGSGLPTSETFVHEVGHSQGRKHVICSGGEAGPDVAYPHAGGRIGVWGFGIYDFLLRTPTGARDYMTYCSNEWDSDYAWEQTLEVIEVLTSWDTGEIGPPQDQSVPLLAGALHRNGSADWWISEGVLDPTLIPSAHWLEVDVRGRTLIVSATTQPQPDGDSIRVVAELPAGWGGATQLRLAGPEHSATVAPAVVGRWLSP